MTRILVLGATGLLGGKVLDRLTAPHPAKAGPAMHDVGAAMHLEIVAGARRPDALGNLGASAVARVDYDDPGTLETALAGIDRLFVVTAGPEGPRHDALIAAAAARAGVGHVVKVSALGVHEGAADPISAWHRAGEHALAAAGLTCSFLRPGAFMSNALTWETSITHGAPVALVQPDLPVACVDPDDIADVAAHLLVSPPPHDSVAYPLTGPEAITPSNQVRVLARLLGRELTWKAMDEHQAISLFTQYGMNARLAQAVAATMASPSRGIGSTTYPTVEAVLNRPARTFEHWATTHLSHFTDTGQENP